eukprot:3059521-Pleurochrysis_carterae.AAC.1
MKRRSSTSLLIKVVGVAVHLTAMQRVDSAAQSGSISDITCDDFDNVVSCLVSAPGQFSKCGSLDMRMWPGWTLPNRPRMPKKLPRYTCVDDRTEEKEHLAQTQSAYSTAMRVHYAYLHGFLSSATSSKGTAMQSAFWRAQQEKLHLLDLNGRSGPSGLTPGGAIDAVHAFWEECCQGEGLPKHESGEWACGQGEERVGARLGVGAGAGAGAGSSSGAGAGAGGEPVRLRLIGSSFGGWAAARYAELFPERVD